MQNLLALIALGFGAVLLAGAALAATLGRGPAADHVSRSAQRTAAILGAGLVVASALLALAGASARRPWSPFAAPSDVYSPPRPPARVAPGTRAPPLTPSPQPPAPGEGEASLEPSAPGEGEASPKPSAPGEGEASFDATPEPTARPQLVMEWWDATGELMEVVNRLTPEEYEAFGYGDRLRALPEGHALFAVRVRVSNRGASDAELDPRSLTLAVSGQPAQLAWFKGQSFLRGGTVRPGATRDGLVVFAMPAALGDDMQGGLGELGYSGGIDIEAEIHRK